MTTTYLYTFSSVVVVSLISFIGIFTLSLKEHILRKYIFVFISIAVGALLGDALIHLIPEAFENSNDTILTSTLVIAGILLFFVIEKFMHWHHHGEDKEDHVHAVGKLVLFSDGIHNFMDGIIIAASFLLSTEVGLATTLAVILHEIPQEIGDFAVLLHSGYTKARALWMNFLSALMAVLGSIMLFALGDMAQSWIIWFVPMAAGGFIYIAVADLIPELHKTKEVEYSIIQLAAVITGVASMIALVYLE